ncbi:tRNA 2-selenouridine(34) synthase MnmH [Halomonas sp. TD01]|uniref:tRNA 2-selenouridine(34) synthase MnmH n=1 Tax=Halomonas sp. TD01 TaxID=999141 RepID=UPI000214D67B|nr:tRNA 2-selenouridine(34) synthase MnmH [Halomonas sp. TD01]EGP18146.1 tRNA 2-selenouridine synthase [Halomonas sp. TD01]CAH1043300.1 Selenophosphate-dependent tRNA 2-selenouridine synthase [Halomonas sp. TD01]
MTLATVPATLNLIAEETPLIDVRAPIEFAQGSLPGAVNLPLMVDDERHQVGIAYKQLGQQAAIGLGERLVSGEAKQARVDAWEAYVARQPEAIIYCFRGGLRSQIAQQWLAETGINRPRIEGGWKAVRHRLCQRIDEAASQPMLVVAGLTGCAKTTLINQLSNGIDLEAFANHKGSAFGRQPEEPTPQIDFEHALAKRLIGLTGKLVVEDESRQIGNANIPLTFWHALQRAPRIRIEMPLDWRLEQLRRDYIEALEQSYTARYGQQEGWQRMQRQLANALERLAKRLGNARLQRLQRLQCMAFDAHALGNIQAHEAWLAPLLTEYYDPLYRYHLEKQRDSRPTELHVGDWDSCLEAAKQWSA